MLKLNGFQVSNYTNMLHLALPEKGLPFEFVPFHDGRRDGAAVAVLTGFLDAEGNAYGRPVGVAIDRRNEALLVADDVGNAIWRVTAAAR